MSDVPIAQPVEDPQGVIVDDMPCVMCGYNLRGLHFGGRCPECGSPVNRSVHGNLLKYADADWLAKLLLGIRLMLWSIVIGIVVGLLGGLATVLGAPRAILACLGIIMSGLEVATALLITVQEPRISLSEDLVTWRKVIRVCAGVAALGQIFQQFGTVLAAIQWLGITGMALGLVGVVAYFGKLVYLGRFALRVPDPALARSTRIVMWGYGISSAIAIVGGLLAAFVIVPGMRTAMMGGPAFATTAPASVPSVFPFAPARTSFVVTTGPAAAGFPAGGPFGPAGPSTGAIVGMIGMGAAGCVGGVGCLVFGIWYLVLLFRYRNVFREALNYARGLAGERTAASGPQVS